MSQSTKPNRSAIDRLKGFLSAAYTDFVILQRVFILGVLVILMVSVVVLIASKRIDLTLLVLLVPLVTLDFVVARWFWKKNKIIHKLLKQLDRGQSSETCIACGGTRSAWYRFYYPWGLSVCSNCISDDPVIRDLRGILRN